MPPLNKSNQFRYFKSFSGVAFNELDGRKAAIHLVLSKWKLVKFRRP